MLSAQHVFIVFFFFNDTATTEIYTLSLHDALPIFKPLSCNLDGHLSIDGRMIFINPNQYLSPQITKCNIASPEDRKSTRLNSSHANISYAVFCLKKKKKNNIDYSLQLNFLSHTYLP